MRKILIAIGALFILLLLALLGSYIYSFVCPPPEVIDKYAIFRDVLTIVLAIAAVAIAVVGYVVYRYLDEHITRHAIEEVRSAARVERYLSSAYRLVSSGYTYWVHYTNTKEKNSLELAISITERAYTEHAVHLDEHDREHQELICTIKNNLGYYLAERGKPEDGHVAHQCVEYIRSKEIDFPKRKTFWEDTYRFVINKYPAAIERTK